MALAGLVATTRPTTGSNGSKNFRPTRFSMTIFPSN
jgi:hypothetical protein